MKAFFKGFIGFFVQIKQFVLELGFLILFLCLSISEERAGHHLEAVIYTGIAIISQGIWDIYGVIKKQNKSAG